MKKTFFICTFLIYQLFLSQDILINRVVKTNPNKDKFLYKIEASNPNAEYLGEIEVRGFSTNDSDIYGKIYKKAKEIGANALVYKPFETIDAAMPKFDASNYKLSLYYLPKEKFPKENNVVYIFSPTNKEKTISFNKQVIKFNPRTFTKKKLQAGEIYQISTRKLLGSSVKILSTKDQPAQYMQISGFKLSSSQSNEGGLNLKSRDIILLEKSYAEFLTIIYQEF